MSGENKRNREKPAAASPAQPDKEYEFYEHMYQKPEPELPAPSEEALNGAAARMEMYDWLQCIVIAISCAILLFVFVGRAIGVEGSSMLPTLHDMDKVLIFDLFYEPKYGDIVILKTDSYEEPLVKRVIAVAGQTIDINFETHQVFVDGAPLKEPYINEPTASRIDFEGPVTVPEGHVFVMGDNRNASTDSRSDKVGMVDTRNILGKVLMVLLPGGSESQPRDWTRIGSVY